MATAGPQGDRQYAVRKITSTAWDPNGDLHALFDAASIQAGDFSGRALAYINAKAAKSFTAVEDALAWWAMMHGADTPNALRYWNLWTSPNDFSNAAWGTGNGSTKVGLHGSIAAPDGTLTACQFDMGATGGAFNSAGSVQQNLTFQATTYREGFWVRTLSGASTVRLSCFGAGMLFATGDTAISDSWQFLEFAFTGAAVSGNAGIRNNVAGNSGSILVWGGTLSFAQ